ncbi:hypothetical protein D3C72_1610650 [compost metagenome]
MISFKRHLTSFNRYSLSPLRNSLRVTVTVENSVGRILLLLLKVSETSARFAGFLFFVPLKIIFSILSERSIFVLCSPSTQRMASTTLDFPHPLGPTIAVTPSLKLIVILSPKLLNPLISSLVNCIYTKFVCRYKLAKIVKLNNNFFFLYSHFPVSGSHEGPSSPLRSRGAG